MKSITHRSWLVASVGALLVLPGCRENSSARMDPEWLRLEAERVKLEHQVELMKLRLSKVGNHDVELAERSAILDNDAESLALLKEKAGLLEGELKEMAAGFERERVELLRALRSNAAGRSFDRLVGASGRTFEKVIITRVTDVGIEFRHSTGSARLAASELSSSQQGMFGIDPGIASEALQEEAAVARAYDSWVDERVAIASAREKAEEAELAAAEAARPRPAPVIASAAQAPTRLRDRSYSVGSDRNTTWYPYSYSYSRSRYSYYRPSYSPCYSPTPYAVRSFPNIRVASSNWSYTPRVSRCTSTPVITRRPVNSFTYP